MALGRKGLTCGGIKGSTVCCVCVFLWAVCVLYTVGTLLCTALLCRAVQSSVQELTGERTVLFTCGSLPQMQN
ncbi:unnamed protein product, partial [Staurois parvus]